MRRESISSPIGSCDPDRGNLEEVPVIANSGIAKSSAHSTETACLRERIRELENENQLLREEHGILEDLPVLVCQLSPAGVLEYVNEAYCRYFSKRREDLIGSAFLELIPENKHEWALAELAKLSPEAPLIVSEYSAIAPDGTVRVHRWTDRAIYDENNTMIAIRAYGEDITRQKRLEREVLDACEREEARIGQNLHNTVCQNLRAIGFLAEGLERHLSGSGQPSAAGKAETIRRYLAETLTEARGVAKGLYPVSEDDSGLMIALEELAAYTSKQQGVRCDFRCSEPVVVSDNDIAIQAYRIAREAVSNAMSRESAGKILIELARCDGDRVLTVWDDGRGSEREAEKGDIDAKPLLHVMRYRAGLIGGTLEVSSTPGRGTLVRCAF